MTYQGIGPGLALAGPSAGGGRRSNAVVDPACDDARDEPETHRPHPSRNAREENNIADRDWDGGKSH